jgi:hypothetical protein
MISSLLNPSQTFQQPPRKDCEEHNAAVFSFKLQHALANITNSAGTKLSKWVTNPRYSQPSQRHATFIYPNQAKPNSTVWNDFVKLLQLAFTDGINNKLRQPLGNWYRGRISQAWNQVFSPADHKIYSLETEPRRTVQVYE